MIVELSTTSDPSPDESQIAAVCPTIGEDGIARVVAAFYRQVPGDELLGPMYPPHDLAAAEARLRGFLTFRFGGSDQYVRERGHPRLRMRHAPFAVSQAARERWVQLMDRAIAESEIPANVAAVMRTFLHRIATFLINS